MKIFDIKKHPDKVLRRKSQPVARITEREMALFQDMLHTMHHCSGIGLAAPQIGINIRLFVVDIGKGPLLIANPKILKIKGKDRMEEGCLSLPDVVVNIERPSEVVIRGLNEKGETVEIDAKGLLARVILHEIDHLQGRLIIDYMSLLNKIKFNLSRKKSQS